jgi:alkylhydroperoxidase/carboxymuconolactone decarboxylase family protein YurZ
MAMTDSERLARGKQICKKMYGDVLPTPADTGGDAYMELTLKNFFNDVLGREILSMRDKRWIILGAIAGLGANPSLFEIHARSALGNGEMTTEDLYEFILLVLGYIGHPRTTPLKSVVDKLIAEEKAKT